MSGQLAQTPGEPTAAPQGEQASQPMALEKAPNIVELGLGARINGPLLALCEKTDTPTTIGGLMTFTALDLLKQKRFGRLALLKLRRALFERGVHLSGDESWDPSEPVDSRGRHRKGKARKNKGVRKAVVKRPAWVPLPSIRGSAFNAGLTCPGSVFLGQKSDYMKVEQENQYTSVGKIGHKYLELRITKSRAAAESFLDNEGASSEFRVELADLWDWLCESELLPALTREEAAERNIELLAEQSLSYKAGGVTITGTMDLIEVIYDAAIVVDWKFYNRPEMLPPIDQDMQMIAYAVGAWKRFGVRQVTVHRVLGYHQRADTIELNSDTLTVALDAVTEEAERIWENRRDLRPGAQCRGCFQSFHCPAMEHQFKSVETGEMQPYEGGDFMSRDGVLQFLLAVPLVESRIKEGMAAAKRFVEALGEPVLDRTSGMEWGPSSRKQDSIIDAAGCLAELMQITSQEQALTAAKTTKGGMEKVMKGAKLKPAERKEFFEFLRDRGLMVNCETSPRWEWRRPKEV